MVEQFPSISGIIEEALAGYTVTIFLRAPGRFDGVKLIMIGTDTVDQARGIVSEVARECSIAEASIKVEIRMFNRGQAKRPMNR
jgi:hypothetical protein